MQAVFLSPPCPPPPSFPRLTSRAAEPKLKITHTKKTPAKYSQAIKFASQISGRLSLFLDPSEAGSLSPSLDAQGEKMSWSWHLSWVRSVRDTQQIDSSDLVFNTPSSTQALEINNCCQKKGQMKNDNTIPKTSILCRLVYQGYTHFLFICVSVCVLLPRQDHSVLQYFKSQTEQIRDSRQLYSISYFFDILVYSFFDILV